MLSNNRALSLAHIIHIALVIINTLALFDRS